MFVCEIPGNLCPGKKPAYCVLLAGLLSMGLLIALSYYASSRIVKPIQRLRDEARRIAGGDLSQPEKALNSYAAVNPVASPVVI